MRINKGKRQKKNRRNGVKIYLESEKEWKERKGMME
jgi:hypothetical protein